MRLLKDPNELVGKPYDSEMYHCWHFIEECLDVPKLHHIAVSTAQADFNENIPFFIEIDEPINYCLAVLGTKHVGIYKDNHIYHADRDMVKCESLRAMRRKYNTLRYFDKH